MQPSKAINSGRLNRRIQVQTQTAGQDNFGQPLPVWTTVYTCWASVDIQQSQLIYATAEFVSKVTHRIECRWTSSFIFQASQRIIYVEPATGITHTYEIIAPLNDRQANRKLILMCYELDGKE